ncbi:hypothetical protein Pflav_056420 [Phytohabitans flavus]|uniref:ABC transmembrane type-1 domain-containing protein n=1 Tax=Phytohabitans flavus TaxID=1076124 RepID=A0A6F8XZE5_9ACTN|nr:hypothetical protein [Phytohabitans flavus]BCB79232.1 hypothetical protein Pflav_056420 [Phytohabitans flavus]
MTVTSADPPSTHVPSTPEGPQDSARRIRERRPPSDQLFRGVARAGGTVVLLIMLLVGIFLTRDALPAWREAGLGFLTTQAWDPQGGDFGIAGVLVGTLLIGMVAISVAVPLAFGASLFISEYAPARIKPVLVNLVDLMAAVPSVVYGIWGCSSCSRSSSWSASRARACPAGWRPTSAGSRSSEWTTTIRATHWRRRRR